MTFPTAKNTRPKVSVCIPTYRGAATIAAAIESVLAQSFSDFELVVIDDGSPDDTQSIVERFEDARLRYLRNPQNLGPEGNWNRCLKEAKGEYFKLLPHDDLLKPDCLLRQVDVLNDDTDQKIALVFCRRDILSPSGKILMQRGYPGANEGQINASAAIRACVRRGTNLIGEPGAVMFRKELAEKVGGFNSTNPYVIDLDYWFRLLFHGDAYFCKPILSSFRVSSQSWSVVIGSNQDRDFISFVKRTRGGLRTALSLTDHLAMQVTARVNKWLRLVFYAIYLK